MIGIDDNRFVMYEGQTNYGHAVWPQPQISRAKIIEAESDWKNPPHDNDRQCLIFREDTFDPLTRIRRGRLYKPDPQSNPSSWRVQPHPAYDEGRAARDNGGYLNKMLLTYVPFHELSLRPGGGVGTTILLGAGNAATPWTVIGVERNFGGENSVTLRSRSNFGRLPEVDEDHVPAETRHEILEAISGLSDRAFRESPVSLIDRCGNVAQFVLSRWLKHVHNDAGCLTKDLAAVAAHIENNLKELVILYSSVKVLARLHARGKPNVQTEKSVRVPGEADAETSLALVSTILLEIGWGVA